MFGAVRSTFCQNLTFPYTRSKSRRSGLKLSPNRVNSAISIEGAQNASFGSWGASFRKVSLFRIPDLKMVVLASNHHQIGKTVEFLKKVHKRRFGAVRSTIWQNLTFPHTRSQDSRTGLKSSPNRENSGISKKSAQNASSRPCGTGFAKIWLFCTPDLKIVVLASNHRQIGKTVRFLWKVHKTRSIRLSRY